MTAAEAKPVRKLAKASLAELTEAAAAAAEVLRAGKLVALPTETVYGLAAAAHTPEGPERLRAATGARRPPGGAPGAWHAHSADFALGTLALTSPIHRRLTRRLLPGPVTFLIERTPEQLEALSAKLGGATDLDRSGSKSVLFSGRELALRVPDHPVARAVLEAACKLGIPVVADGAAAAGWGDGARIDRAIPPALDPKRPDSPVGLILDAGPTRFARPSTVVRLLAEGGFKVVSEGVLEERYIRKQLERTILFVCTGNTCRSPMAEAIARHILAEQARGADEPTRAALALTKVRSAGAGAYDGAPVSPEAVDAVESLGIDGAALARHTSHELTRQMIAEADVIYTMTAQHQRAVQSVSPADSAKVRTLDPTGEDIPDPVGMSQDVYTETAQRLNEAVRARLAEPE